MELEILYIQRHSSETWCCRSRIHHQSTSQFSRAAPSVGRPYMVVQDQSHGPRCWEAVAVVTATYDQRPLDRRHWSTLCALA